MEIASKHNKNVYLISEFFEFKVDKNVLREADEKGGGLYMTGVLQRADAVNRNGRIYPYDILKREATKYMELVENKTAGGELDHSSTAVVALSNVSHRVVDMWWQGKDLYGRIRVAENTDAGRKLKGLLDCEFTLGISSRGVGSVKTVSGKDIVQDDFELVAFDIVSSPSTNGAYMFKEGVEQLKEGMILLNGSNKKQEAVEIIKEEREIQSELQTKLLELSNNDFWKNL